MSIGPVGADNAWSLYLASLPGVEELADELERIGLSDGQDAIEDAEALRVEVLRAAEEVRGG